MSYSGAMRSPGSARVAIWLLVFAAASIGILAGAAPHTFYSDFPFFSHWVDLLPPYNQHLTTDVGGLYLGFAVIFVWAAVTLQPTLVQASCCAWLLTETLHFAFHATHLDGFTTAEGIEQMASLAFLLVPAVAAVWAVGEPASERA
jgi:hypothetical protein